MESPEPKTLEISLAGKIAGTLVNYVKTQFLVFPVVTIVTWIILNLLGIKYSLLLAFVTGSLSIVPLVGMSAAALITGTVAVFDGVRFLNGFHPVFEGIVIIIIYIILNQLIDFFLTPYLIGKTSKVNPLLILLTVIIGTWLFGIVGAVLSVPVLLVVMTILKHYSEK
jgi:predicted PurR-regulated permease PerM